MKYTPANKYDTILSDRLLSWGAKGLLIALLNAPKGWEMNIAQLVSSSPDGISRVRNLLNELIFTGYVTRRRLKNDRGSFSGIHYEFFYEPQPVLTNE